MVRPLMVSIQQSCWDKKMKTTASIRLVFVGLLTAAMALNMPANLTAQDAVTDPPKVPPLVTGTSDVQADDPAIETKTLHDHFRNNLTNSRFIGKFTVAGKEDKLPSEEEYTISSVKKLDKGDYWEITARIKYGDHDVTVPMAMEVKWAGKTPVITVDKLFVPGLGVFDARVLLRKNQYAGTWAHGDVGGHLFGRIEKIEEQPDERETDKK